MLPAVMSRSTAIQLYRPLFLLLSWCVTLPFSTAKRNKRRMMSSQTTPSSSILGNMARIDRTTARPEDGRVRKSAALPSPRRLLEEVALARADRLGNGANTGGVSCIVLSLASSIHFSEVESSSPSPAYMMLRHLATFLGKPHCRFR